MSLLRRVWRASQVFRRWQHTKPKLSVSGDVIPIFANTHLFPERVALRDLVGSYSYANLFISSKELAGNITQKLDGKTNQRVLFLCSNDATYVIALWAIWMSGQIAVPLSPLHPKSVHLYYANDAAASLLITTDEYADAMQKVSQNTNTPLHVLDADLRANATAKTSTHKSDLEGPLSLSFYSGASALIVYTSGTTGSPKGVTLAHKNVVFQVNALLEAWRWSAADVILHALPLHHVHGIVNALLCPLCVGAKTIMLPKFSANAVWSHMLGVNARPDDRRISVFMGVPTIYANLIEEYEKVFSGDTKMAEYIKNTLKNKIRLMVSGSAALPSSIFDKWLEISGHRLLERYGMTEVGMALSNLYDSEREPGYVGLPLPGVSVRLVDGSSLSLEVTNNNGEITCETNDKSMTGTVGGELLVKSDGVFKEYYNRPEATRKEFAKGGWFKTGDAFSYSFDKNNFKILGRKSADIIKSAGFKISALEVEAAISTHPNVKECVVVGVEDKKFGQRVGAVVVVREGKSLGIDELKKWAADKMPRYSVPSMLKVLEEIPKNAMGKVNKKELVGTVFK